MNFHVRSSRCLIALTTVLFFGACMIMPANTLEQAVIYNNQNEVKRHLNEGVDVNKPGTEGKTPLHFAAEKGRLDIIKILLAYEGNEQAVTVLLENGADINARDKNQRNALHHAALLGRNRAALILVKHKIPVDAKDEKGHTPLYLACLGDEVEMVKFLINKGASVTPSGPSPIVAAAREGSEESAKILLNHKAPVNGPAQGDDPPLHAAAARGHHHMVKLLLERGADIHRKNSAGKTALYYAVDNNHDFVAEQLIDKGADVNQRIPEGNLLHLAAQKGHHSVARTLVEKGIKLKFKNTKSQTPLDVAIEYAHQNVADLITTELVARKEMGK